MQQIEHIQNLEFDFDLPASDWNTLPHGGDGRMRPRLATAVACDDTTTLLGETRCPPNETIERILLRS